MKGKTRIILPVVLVLGLSLILFAATISLAAPGDIERVSLFWDDGSLVEKDSDSRRPSISGDGRFVAFENLQGGYSAVRIYVHDRELNLTQDLALQDPYHLGTHVSPDISADGNFLAFVRGYQPLEEDRVVQVLVLEWQEEDGTIIVIDPPVADWTDLEYPSISADGCRVAYQVSHGDEYRSDIYLYDCVAETSTLLTHAYGSTDPADKRSSYPAISDDGLFVAFVSEATNLLGTVLDEDRRLYVHDLTAQTTELIPLHADYADIPGKVYEPSISADGRFVAYTYVSEGDDSFYEVFVYDRQTGETSLVSLIDGEPSGDSEYPSISGDGRFVSFDAYSQDENEDWHCDVYVHDLWTGETELVSKGMDGNPGNEYSYNSAISADGRSIAFQSEASNLVADDTNEAVDIFVYENDITFQVTFSLYLPGIQR